jgi:hypothetical protein
MDLNKLSDAELDATLGKLQGGAKPAANLESMSDEELDRTLAGLQNQGSAPTLQEMHPQFTTVDRLVVKNLATDPTAQVNYLQKKYPDLEVSLDDESGQVKARKRDGSEDAYRVLDPDTGLFSGDTLLDLGDVAYDIGAGVASGAATTAGGLLGGAATGGVGAIPAAAAAGASSSAGLEALRQKLGQLVGIDQEMDYAQVGFAGAGGAIAPLAFGTGATAAGAKAVASKFGQNTDELLASQRGLVGKAYDYVAPKVGELFSGVSEDTLRYAGQNLDELKKLEADGILDYADTARQEINDTLWQAKQKIGDKIGTAIDSADQPVNISPVKKRLEKLIADLDKSAEKNPAMAEKAAQVRETYNRLFPSKVQEVEKVVGTDYLGRPVTEVVQETSKLGDTIDARTAFELKDELADLADLGSTPTGGFLSRFSQGQTRFDKRVSQTLKAGYDDITSELARVTEQVDGGTGVLNKEYKRLNDIQRSLNPYFSNMERTAGTMRNLSSKGKRTVFEQLQRLDKDLGTNMTKKAKLIEAESLLGKGKASVVPISSNGATSTTRSLSAQGIGMAAGLGAGQQADLDPATTAILGLLGGGVANRVVSPAAMRQYIGAGSKVRSAGRALRDSKKLPSAPAASNSAWNLFLNEDK